MYISHPRTVETHLHDLFCQLNDGELLELYRKGIEVSWDSDTMTAQISRDALAPAWAGSVAVQKRSLHFVVKVEQHPDHPRVPLRLEHLPEQWRNDCGDLEGSHIADPDWSPGIGWIRAKAATLHHACAWQWLVALYADSI